MALRVGAVVVAKNPSHPVIYVLGCRTYAALDDGQYTFQARTQTAAGTYGPVSTASFLLDTTPPTVTSIAFHTGCPS